MPVWYFQDWKPNYGLYSKGISTRDIFQTLKEMYGVEVDATFVSRVTNKIIPHITERRNRPLEKNLCHGFYLWNKVKVKEENKLVKKSVYIVMRYSL
ncbi:transposase, partial [Mycoplasma sp. 2261]